MENFQLQCKLCGGTVTDDNFRGIDDDIERIFNVLLLKLSSDKDNQYVLCEVCSTKLFAAFNFKSTCLHMDNSIKLYVDSGNPAPVDLQKIYAKQKGKKQGEICRLCFQPMVVKSVQKSIEDVPLDSIQIYIPEINFALTSKPAICFNCFDSLHVHSTFVKNCLDMEEKKKIKGTLTNPCVKTGDVEIKFEEAKEGEVPVEILDSGVKKEAVEEGGPALVLSNGVTDVVKTESDGDAQQQEINAPPAQMHRCSQCQYQTYSRLVLANHELKHRDPLENMGPALVSLNGVKDAVQVKTESDVEAQQQEIKAPPAQMHRCSQCSYQTYSTLILANHELKHRDHLEHMGPALVLLNGVTDAVQVKTDRDGDAQQQEINAPPQMHKCSQCPYQTYFQLLLTSHELKHRDPLDVQIFKCDECEYETTRKGSLTQHKLKHMDPSEVQIFRCSECTYAAKHKKYLDLHRLKHSVPLRRRAPIFKCDKCKFATKLKSCLVKHRLRHKSV